MNYELIIELDKEWSLFLSNTPEQLGCTIAQGNLIFEKEVNKWCVNIGLKYEICWQKIKERYKN